MLWPKKSKEEVRMHNKAYRKNRPEKQLLISASNRAKAKGLEFNITEEDIVIPTICPYLKTPFIPNSLYAASLDRIDSNKGYTKGNVEVISRKANMMKLNASVSELLEFAYTILERH